MNDLTGQVTGHRGHYFQVECPEAPEYLRMLHLAPSQMMGARVGNRVRLEYQVTLRSGLWNVAEILSPDDGEAARTTRLAYVAHCPSCGHKLVFAFVHADSAYESVRGVCHMCSKRWSFLFDLDKSGTFGVMSFQCDNGDRV